MHNRRDFLMKNAPGAAMASAAMLSPGPGGAASEGPINSYLVECVTFRVHFGPQMANALGWIEKRAMPLWQKHKFGPVGVFTVDVGPHIPAIFFMRVYASLADRQAVWKELSADADWAAAIADLEKDGPAFHREDSMLLASTPFSPPINPASAGDPIHRLFELRIYEAPTWKQLGYLHDRFAGGEIALFHKSGIHPVFYADTLIGPNQPHMVYMSPFENVAARETAWAKFRDDPEWIKLRDESIRKGGEIVRNIANLMLAPASFSMIR